MTGVREGRWLVRLDRAGGHAAAFMRAVVRTGEELRLDWPAGELRIEAGELAEAQRIEVITVEVAGLRIAERIPEDVRIAASLDPGQGNTISVPGLGEGVYEVRITDADGEILASREVRTRAGLTSLRFE